MKKGGYFIADTDAADSYSVAGTDPLDITTNMILRKLFLRLDFLLSSLNTLAILNLLVSLNLNAGIITIA